MKDWNGWKELAVPLQGVAAPLCFISAQNLALMYTSTVAQGSHKATLADKPEIPRAQGIHALQNQWHQLHIILPPCGGAVDRCQQQLMTMILQLLEQLLGASVDLKDSRIFLRLLWTIARAEAAGLILPKRPHSLLSDPLSGCFLSTAQILACRERKPEMQIIFCRRQGFWICPTLDLGGRARGKITHVLLPA